MTQEAKRDQPISAAPSIKSAIDPPPTLLVLGADPKGIAIAAKRHMLAKLGYPVPNVRILDRQGVASHWSGQAGYTDGNQFLGTRPEKDVGFPYLSACWGDKALSRAVAKNMVLLSWQSYLIDQLRYSDWIDRTRTRPTHGEWSQYIQWVAEQVELDLCMSEVTRIGTSTEQKHWQVTCQPSAGGSPFTLTGDGLVMTGPGVPLTIVGQPEQHSCIMDGASFWRHVEEFEKLRWQVKKPLNIGVIGTGETAAAIVVALVDALRSSVFIEVISPNGVMYTRDEEFEENKFFSDPDGKLASLYGGHRHAANWLQLSERDRRECALRSRHSAASSCYRYHGARRERIRWQDATR